MSKHGLIMTEQRTVKLDILNVDLINNVLSRTVKVNTLTLIINPETLTLTLSGPHAHSLGQGSPTHHLPHHS